MNVNDLILTIVDQANTIRRMAERIAELEQALHDRAPAPDTAPERDEEPS